MMFIQVYDAIVPQVYWFRCWRSFGNANHCQRILP
jgi:hypothetical protein